MSARRRIQRALVAAIVVVAICDVYLIAVLTLGDSQAAHVARVACERVHCATHTSEEAR